MSQPAEVLKFWFGSEQLQATSDKSLRQRWFARSEAFDSEIEQRFGHLVESALAGKLNDWRDTLMGELALVLVCDQFTRNIYRGTARAFAGDALALEVALAAIDRGDDRKLGLSQRAFLGLPLEHDERAQIQRRSVDYFKRLRDDYVAITTDCTTAGSSDATTDASQSAQAAQTESFYQYALAHQKVIDEFGRFPHRNAALGRATTAAEQAWLNQGGGF
ncbi:hypothetical protein Maes01_01017 [Microbulbifer aestuariivivens]|uniref:DUF924 domain-containing protein n=1 Tax=Microbulbifer aestuariivivens TaxID=1908308 RepID=A0ABP9WMX6_9GAMM